MRGLFLREERTASRYAGTNSTVLAVDEVLPISGWLYNRAICGRFLRDERTASGHAGTNSTILAVVESLPMFVWC